MGTEVNLVATPNAGCNFICWRFNRSGFVLSYNETIKLYPRQNVDLIAVFEDPNSPTGGWNGSEETNPLPGAEAEIIFDGVTKTIESGSIEIATAFDNLAINNIGDNHNVVYVPSGSSLGDATCVTLEPNAGENADYWMSASNSGSGAIYIDNNLWFYISVVESMTIVSVNTIPAQIGDTVNISVGSEIQIAGNNMNGEWMKNNGQEATSVTNSLVTFDGYETEGEKRILYNGNVVLTINVTSET